MRTLLRCISALLLMALLLTFCLWRYEKIDTVMAHFDDAMSRLGFLTTLSGGGGEKGDDTPHTPSVPYDPDGNYSDYDLSQAVGEELLSVLREGIGELKSQIDLTGISPLPTKDEVKAAMASIIYSSPEFFYLKSSYSISASQDGTARAVSPGYTATPEEVAAMRVTYEAALGEIVAGAPQNGTDFDKILYLHDYFIQNYSYDYDLLIRDAYTFFTEKEGVCQAYMLALIAAAERLGIESLPVTSDAMKHAWNLVLVDGAWYHVDLTWDDKGDLPTLTSYTYFLQSDAGLTKTDATCAEEDRHRDWIAAEAATDTKYDAAVFRAAKTPMIRHNGVYYCTGKAQSALGNVRGVIYAGTDVTAMTKLREITGGYWWAQNGYYYTDCYAGLAAEGDYLYYHSGNTIRRIDLRDSSDHLVKLVGLGTGESIFGLFGIKDGKLTYLVAKTLDASDPRTEAYTIS